MNRITYPLVMAVWTIVCGDNSQAAEQPVSIAALPREMVDVESMARWPVKKREFTSKQASSYDRAKVAPDQPGWFAINDNTQYLSTEQNDGRIEHVMMDTDGPGAIARFWLTASRPKDGVLRIYLDHAREPLLSFPGFDLLEGDLRIGEPLAQARPDYSPQGGGSNLYLPIPTRSIAKWRGKRKARGLVTKSSTITHTRLSNSKRLSR